MQGERPRVSDAIVEFQVGLVYCRHELGAVPSAGASVCKHSSTTDFGELCSCSGESHPPAAKTLCDSSWHREAVSSFQLLLLWAHEMLMGVCQVTRDIALS